MKNNLFDIPILFIVFTRLETTVLVFEKIKNIRPSKLYIASDGPRKNKNEKQNVEAVRKYILDNITWQCEVLTKFESNNLGCKYNPQSAISWFFKHEEKGIILEDDVVPVESFFTYCDELLTKYESDLRVWGVSGSNMLEEVAIEESYYFSDFFMTWGWATWRDRWQRHEKQMTDFYAYAKAPLIQEKLNNKAANKKMVSNAIVSYEDKLDAWDYIWIFSCFSNNGLIATPQKNLIENIGFGDGATHTGYDTSMRKESKQINFPLVHPKIISTNKKIDERLFKDVFGWINTFEKMTSLSYILKYLKIKLRIT